MFQDSIKVTLSRLMNMIIDTSGPELSFPDRMLVKVLPIKRLTARLKLRHRVSGGTRLG